MKACQICFKLARVVKKRLYEDKHVKGMVTSQKEMCNKCDRNLQKIFKQNNEQNN